MLTLTMAGEPPRSWAKTAEAGAAEAPTLMALAASGDRNALAALLREHGQAIGQLCHFVAGPRDGRDAAQEAFERIVVSIDKYDPAKGSFRSWALTVARNVCRDRLRRRGLEKAAFTADGETHTDLARAAGPDPEAQALLRADATALEAALEALPEEMRTALVLFHFHEASYEEIAASLDVPIGTVMTWLHRGRKRLKAALEEAA
jgi:RNA polymerase sigma-70 factor (ECF subfamily)